MAGDDAGGLGAGKDFSGPTAGDASLQNPPGDGPGVSRLPVEVELTGVEVLADYHAGFLGGGFVEPRGGGDECRKSVNGLGEGVGEFAAVLGEAVDAPKDVAGDAVGIAGTLDLADDFLGCPGAADAGGVVAGPEVAAVVVLLGPPLEEDGVALGFLIDGPVELGGEVIDPAGVEPFAGIGVEVVVGFESADLVGLAGFPDAEGAEAEFDPGFDGLDGGVEAFDEAVDVVAAPVVAGELAAAVTVALPTGLVGEVDGFAGGVLDLVGVEVIVEVDAVDVVAAEDVEDDAEGVFGGVVFAGVEPELFAVGADEAWLGAADMVGGDFRFGGIVAGAEGVEPGVEFQAAGVGLGDGKSKRIERGFGRFAHLPGEVFGPGFVGRGVEGIAGRPDLEDDGVEMEGGGAVEYGDEGLLLFGDREAGFGGPVDVGDGGDPGAAEFAREAGGIDVGGRVVFGSGDGVEEGKKKQAGEAAAGAGRTAENWRRVDHGFASDGGE